MKPATGWWWSRGLPIAVIGRSNASESGRIFAMLQYLDLATLEQSLDHIREAPADLGTLELIVRRPAVDEREVLTEVRVDTVDGLEGDTWRVRGSSRTTDGGPNPAAQLTVVNARASAAIAGDRDRWPLAGDQLYVDLHISVTNLPPASPVPLRSAAS